MFSRRWNSPALPVFFAALALTGTASAGDGVTETTVYGIANFGGAGQCGTSDMTHTVHTDTAAAFKSPFDTYKAGGLWEVTRTVNNGSARGTYWTDDSQIPSCGSASCAPADDVASGVDSADVVYVHTHGYHNFDYFGWNGIPNLPQTPSNSGIVMGTSTYGCNVQTDNQFLFGNLDLNVAVVKACQSGDYDVWLDGGYWGMVSGEFTMWNAFHGDSSCDGSVTSYVGSYASESFSDGIGENWLDEAYDSWGADDCPVSIVYGSTAANRDSMYYNGGFRDLKNTGSKTGSSYYYVLGCSPDAGRTLPG